MNSSYLYAALLGLSLSACGGASGSSTDSGSGGNSGPSPSPSPSADQIEHLAAGDATVAVKNSNAFSEHSNNLKGSDKIVSFNLGNDFFENPWVAGSASTSSRDGLGGLFNNNACQDCHVRDGRGHAPMVSATEDGTDFSTILLRAAKSEISADTVTAMHNGIMANVGDSTVGGQLQQDSVSDVQPEVELSVSYSDVTVSFADGHDVVLRKPEWHMISTYAAEGYDFDDDTIFSARVAPQMIGLGLIALIPELDIVALADENDSNGDGISGKANYVWSVKDDAVRLGRFGWKSGQPSLIEQAAGAFLNDMGLTSRFHQNESCMAHQEDCQLTANGNGDANEDYNYEVSDKILDAVGFYSAHLAVPERRDAYSDDVQAGKTLFNEAGCVDCHVASYVTETDPEFPELSGQTIFPYTDMLLHDMGEELADFDKDNRPASASVAYEFQANAREWRTSPLWGIGLAKAVDPEATFLHDGRARTILEAVLWHGGEAQAAKEKVLQFTAKEREQFMAFLNDL
ncbi:di-heme oxidoredictase family protein [Agaribacterium sp. ZY112]|uniref:di-heme oxidoreductase family protein n=1 Tax=Agaribacterium sp. ZY112 TaxID=3233574 RepID=UPI003525CC2F